MHTEQGFVISLKTQTKLWLGLPFLVPESSGLVWDIRRLAGLTPRRPGLACANIYVQAGTRLSEPQR